IISSASILLVPVIIRAISSTYGDGYLSISNYALKLVDLPLTVVLSVFSIIFLPKLSGINGVNDRKKFNIIISDLIFVILLLSSIISIIIYMFSDYIVSFVYGWGYISEDDILAISNILRIAIFTMI
ncbi:lipid II flippase MurJ, partial [Morganella morganii]|uniref:lipid II flippase MurJ n=1 Tax=Morganella morganii TaxID=582 RepID=UPI0013D80EF1